MYEGKLRVPPRVVNSLRKAQIIATTVFRLIRRQLAMLFGVSKEEMAMKSSLPSSSQILKFLE